MDDAPAGKPIYLFGPYRLDPTRRSLTRAGAPVILGPLAFDVLLCLVERAGRLVANAEMLETVWPGRRVETANIAQAIFTLRKILADADVPILTAPGRGYRLAVEVRVESPGDGLAEPSPEIAGPSHPFPPRAWRVAAILVLALGALTLGTLALWLTPWRANRPAEDPGVVVQAEFQNLTGEPIFDRTLAKVVEIDLGQSPFLAVLPDRQVQETLALMTRSRDAPLTPPLAQEVCARNEGRAVIAGTIAPLGSSYLLTLVATPCDSDRILAAEKTQVVGREAVVGALDHLIDRVRGRLGESPESIQKFDVPLRRVRTASLEALKAYSEGGWRHAHGRMAEAIPFYDQAIALDPGFAAAYASLSAAYTVLGKPDLDRLNITKAYSLRDTVSERLKFLIVSRYHASAAKDLGAAIGDLRAWSATYPRDAAAWANLANLEDVVGQSGQAVADGERALALNPGRESAYVVLAQAYRRAGRPDQALKIANAAIAKGVAGDVTHTTLLWIALARGDGPGVAREIAWARGRTAEGVTLISEAQVAFGQGRIRDGMALFDQARALAGRQGGPAAASPLEARYLVDLGLGAQASALLPPMGGSSDPQDYLFTLAEVGDPARARALLESDLRGAPADTLLNAVYAPRVLAALALRRHDPKAALAALAPALPYELMDFDTPYLRGRACLAAGEGPRAAREFNTILGHPGVWPVSPLYALARLGLARALRLEGDRVGSRRAYQAFLAAWKDADPDVPILQAARAEYAALRPGPAQAP